MATSDTIERTMAPDSTLTHPLHRLRTWIRVFVAFDVMTFAAVFVLFFFWIGLGFDYGLFKLTGIDIAQQSHWFLRAGAIGFLALVLALLVTGRIVRLLTRDFSYPSLALVLEKRYPKVLGDRLITAVELADVKKAQGQGYSGAMVQQTIDEARERVGQVNVRSVFRWKRLGTKAFLFAMFAFIGIATAWAIHAVAVKDFQPTAFAHKFTDVVSIWTERNIEMQRTPWPRRAHIELVNFPASGELRLGKQDGDPKIRARAFEWVIAEPGTEYGWRPMKWADLNNPVFGVRTSALPESAAATDAGSSETGKMVSLKDLTVDEVKAQCGTKQPGLEEEFARLQQAVNDPWNSRKIRQLVVPGDLKLTYLGQSGKTRGDANLTKDTTGDFTGEVTGIAENIVTFNVRGEDFRTPWKQIQLIPPPLLIELKRNEYAPAYLYHPAPIDGPPAVPGQEAVTGQAALRGLRQIFPDKRISLTGERSVFSVAVGTELEIFATADKKLKKVSIAGKTGSVPAFTLEANTPEDGFENFTIPFRGPHTITEQTEFEYTLTDFDNVSAKRSVLIQVTEDQPPTVEIAVDVLRKVGNAYMVTPNVMVPFVKESYVRDDTGLSKVEFEFTYVEEESKFVKGAQALVAAGLANAFGSPVISWATPAMIGANDAIYRQRVASGEAIKTYRVFPCVRFEQEYEKIKRPTYAHLLQKLKEPLQNEGEGVLKQVKLLDPTEDYFDLQKAANLGVKGDGTQTRYKVEMNLVATDVNAELKDKKGFKIVGKKGQNIEPIQLLVVSEQDLLIEISKDEDTQSFKLEELYKRVVDAQTKLVAEIGFLGSPSKEQIENSRVRALDILQDIAKSREQLAGIQVEFERLYKEMYYNRMTLNLRQKYKNEETNNGIIDRIKRILDGTEIKGSFPSAESAVTAFQTPLNEGKAPPDAVSNIAKNEVAKLIAALDDVKSMIIENVNQAKLRQDLQKIIDDQKDVRETLKVILRIIEDNLKLPSITPIKPVTIAAGKTASIKHAIDWKLYSEGEMNVEIETPKDSELVVPKSLKIKDDKNDFSFDVTAGMKPGSYTITLKPFAGKPVELQIIVTK